MTYSRPWRNFRRMQDSACLFACLVYAGAAIHAWRVLPGPNERKATFILAFPALFLALSVGVLLLFGPARRFMRRYVWMTFQAGFGQTPASVLSGLGLLLFAALFIYLQIAGVARGGRYPAGVFSGYAAGIGAIIAQTALTRSFQRDPQTRPVIEAGGTGEGPWT